MKTLKFSEAELISMRDYYVKELRETHDKLAHIQEMLKKLSTSIPGPVYKISQDQDEDKAPKKRGRKSKWGVFIREELIRQERPMTYEEIISAALKHFNFGDNKRTHVRQAIVSSTYRLKQMHSDIRTVGVKGTRIKYLAPSEWFNIDGSLIETYLAKLPSLAEIKAMGKKPGRRPGKKVVAALPSNVAPVKVQRPAKQAAKRKKK
jgi:hypothetical protein